MSPPLLISFYKSVYMYDFVQKMATFVKQQHERRGNILFISTEWHISSYISFLLLVCTRRQCEQRRLNTDQK